MRSITNSELREVLSFPMAVEAMERAFGSLGRGQAAMQLRARTSIGDSKVTTMAAVLPEEGVSGAKVYTTIGGRFTFAVLLFDSVSGALLACMEADELTRFRTAAATVVAARRLAGQGASTLGVFGTGVQAWAHVEALMGQFPIEHVRVTGVQDEQAFAARVSSTFGVTAEVVPPRVAAGAEIVVLATRSPTPVIEAGWLSAGAFVAAIGATLPHTREVGDDVLALSRVVCVEWREQAMLEAGEFRLAIDGPGLARKLTTLDRLVLDGGVGGVGGAGASIEPVPAEVASPAGVHLYKAVGVAIEDVALAAAAYRAIEAGR